MNRHGNGQDCVYPWNFMNFKMNSKLIMVSMFVKWLSAKDIYCINYVYTHFLSQIHEGIIQISCVETKIMAKRVRTHAIKHARMHACMHPRTHTHTHTRAHPSPPPPHTRTELKSRNPFRIISPWLRRVSKPRLAPFFLYFWNLALQIMN